MSVAPNTDWRPIEPGHCALCGQKPDVRPRTLREFCDHWRMSRDKFYYLREHGKAPATIKVGGTLLITREAEDEWRNSLQSVATRSNT